MFNFIFAILLILVIFVPWGYGFFSMVRDICRKVKWLKENDK